MALLRRALKREETAEAQQRRLLSPRIVSAIIRGPDRKKSQPLRHVIDQNIKHIQYNTRGRQKILQTRTSKIPINKHHPSGAYMAHCMATTGIKPKHGKRKWEYCQQIVKYCAEKNLKWGIDTVNRILETESVEETIKRQKQDSKVSHPFFSVWDLNAMHDRADDPVLASSNPGIIAISHTIDNHDRFSMAASNGTLEHMETCLTEASERGGVLAYLVIAPENRHLERTILLACREGRHLDEKIERMIIIARETDSALRISSLIFNKYSKHYIEGFREALDVKFPNLLDNIVSLYTIDKNAVKVQQ